MDGYVSEKLLEMRHFRVLLYPEEPELAPPGPPESFGMLADSYWKGYAPQNQSALAQRMIETLKAYLSHSRQLSLF